METWIFIKISWWTVPFSFLLTFHCNGWKDELKNMKVKRDQLVREGNQREGDKNVWGMNMMKIIIYIMYILLWNPLLCIIYIQNMKILRKQMWYIFSKLKQCGFLGGRFCLLRVVLFRRYVSQDYNFGHRYLVNLWNSGIRFLI